MSFVIDLILPGYSDKNKNWLEETAKNLDSDNEVRTIYWNHWSDFHKKFDPKDKAIDVADVILDDSANIIAKSIGTLVASYVIDKIPEKIKKVILCGLPLMDLSETDKEVIKTAIAKVSVENFICIQNSDDPHGKFDEVSEFLHGINPNFKVVKKEASNHEYMYFSDFTNFLK